MVPAISVWVCGPVRWNDWGSSCKTTVKKKGTQGTKKSTLKEKIIVDAPVDEGIEIDDGSTVQIKVEQTQDPAVEG